MNNNSQNNGCDKRERNPENYIRRDCSQPEHGENQCCGRLGWSVCSTSTHIANVSLNLPFLMPAKISKCKFALEAALVLEKAKMGV